MCVSLCLLEYASLCDYMCMCACSCTCSCPRVLVRLFKERYVSSTVNKVSIYDVCRCVCCYLVVVAADPLKGPSCFPSRVMDDESLTTQT